MNATFATVELAARIDRAEARLSTVVGRAAVEANPGSDAFVEEFGGGVAVYTAPASPMNKVIGIGFEALPTAARLTEIEELFAGRQAPLQAEISTLADPALGSTLAQRGYILKGFENVLGRAIVREDADAPDGSIQVTLTGDRDDGRWLEAAVTGFLHPDEQGVPAEVLPPREDLMRVLGEFSRAPGFRRFFAWMAGELAGVASLRMDQGLAQLCGAATLPAFRRRGVQTALLRRRLADAAREHCDLALMTTQPGSKSMENGYRQGFVLLYSRALLIKEPR